jgi:hypothetical protein
MEINAYVLMTIELFRVQALAARAVGDTDEAEAFESAIEALMEGTGAGERLAPPRTKAWVGEAVLA